MTAWAAPVRSLEFSRFVLWPAANNSKYLAISLRITRVVSVIWSTGSVFSLADRSVGRALRETRVNGGLVCFQRLLARSSCP